MSSFSASTSAEIAENKLSCSLLLISAAAVYFYDRILNLDQEIEVIWLCKNIRPSVPLYIVMNASIIVQMLLQIVPSANMSLQSLHIVDVVLHVNFSLLYLTWGVASTMRVYVLNGRDGKLHLPIAVFIVSLVPIATDIFFRLSDNGDTSISSRELRSNMEMLVLGLPPADSASYWSISTGIRNILQIVGRIALSTADGLVLFATWKKSWYGRYMEGLRAIFDKKPSLSTILLTDATKYFCVLFIMNALSAVLTICNTRVNVTSTYIIMLTDVLTTVLLSRMLLNLRRVVHRDVYASAATDTSLSLHFGDAVQSQAIDISLNPVTDEGDHDSGDDDAAPAGAQEEADTSP